MSGEMQSPSAVETLVSLSKNTESIDNSNEIENKKNSPKKNIKVVTKINSPNESEESYSSDYDQEEKVYECTEDEIVRLTCFSTVISNIIGIDKRVTDHLLSVVETLDGLSDVSEKSKSGYTKISNQIFIEYIMENFFLMNLLLY